MKNISKNQTDKELNYQIRVADDSIVFVDPKSFSTAIKNILSNSQKYAASQIEITARLSKGSTVIEVSDDGPGIPEADRQQVFAPFMRIDNSRNRSSGGIGLGLAIVNRVVLLHKGSVRIEQSESSGAKIVTKWPND